jgi:hypothetical protein
MTKSIWTGTCAAIVGLATAAALAQTTTTPQPGSTPSADQRITLTGCLKAAPSSPSDAPTGTTGSTAGTTAGTPGATGTTGTTGTTAGSADVKFILTNASVSTGDTSTTAGTPGATTTAPASSGSAQTYRLIANPAALTPHLGKKLELTGTLEKSASATETQSADAATPALRVEAGKVVAATCSE